jgi:ABC-type polysaccharide/polyol phosphate transport system ATPase subunit
MSKPAIRVQNLSKVFRYRVDGPSSIKSALVDLVRGKIHLGHRRELQALENISFDIQPGEFVGIMGRNGAGKSTLMKLISGIYTPTSGRVEVNFPIAPLIELGAGFHGDLSGYENIFLNAAILGFGRKATLEALPAILEFSELEEKIDMPVKNYSSGMLVRLGFSIATHLSAPILLIDEVLAVGDAGFQAKCLRKIHDLHAQGRTIVLITHDANAVKNHCTRCLVFAHRRKIYDGPAEEGTRVYTSSVISKM